LNIQITCKIEINSTCYLVYYYKRCFFFIWSPWICKKLLTKDVSKLLDNELDTIIAVVDELMHNEFFMQKLYNKEFRQYTIWYV
jgi:hypothetical protein